jgi:hypothetical protein
MLLKLIHSLALWPAGCYLKTVATWVCYNLELLHLTLQNEWRDFICCILTNMCCVYVGN